MIKMATIRYRPHHQLDNRQPVTLHGALALLRKAEAEPTAPGEPLGAADSHFVKAMKVAFGDTNEEVQSAALNHPSRIIRQQAWLNLNPTEAHMKAASTVDRKDAEMLELAAGAVRLYRLIRKQDSKPTGLDIDKAGAKVHLHYHYAPEGGPKMPVASAVMAALAPPPPATIPIRPAA